MGRFNATLAQDSKAAQEYLAQAARTIECAGTDRAALNQSIRETKEAFFRRHAVAMYDALTENCTLPLRVSELVYSAEHFPGLLPTREQIDAERALKKQIAKEGLEIDQGLFVAQVLADERCGMHLIHAMLRPKREALERIAGIRQTGVVDLGEAKVERKGKVGYVTLLNTKFLNAEDDRAIAALETAVDLVLLDDTIEVGVLRGGMFSIRNTKAAASSMRGSISRTSITARSRSSTSSSSASLVCCTRSIAAQRSGPLRASNTRTMSRSRGSRRSNPSPSAAAVSFSASWTACWRSRARTSICRPARKASFRAPPTCASHGWSASSLHAKASSSNAFSMPTRRKAADLRRSRSGRRNGCSDRGQRRAAHRAGMTSAVSNRKALRVAEEPLTSFRRYMATYARQQSLCLYDQKLIDNLEHSWKPNTRRM